MPTQIIGGVDTHAANHCAAALDTAGRLLGIAEFPATEAGYDRLGRWLRSHGELLSVGVEGTGAYGAGLARFLRRQRVVVFEVPRPDRRIRRNRGKSDPIDAEAAARAVLAGTATIIPKRADGPVEAIRALRVARLGAIKAKTAATNTLRSMLITAPEPLRTQLPSSGLPNKIIDACARLRPDLNHLDDPTHATKASLRSSMRGALAQLQEFLRIAVVHVHGFVPREGAIARGTMVFTEPDYHALTESIFHWGLAEIVEALRKRTVLFLGLSMSDPSLRRLLDASRNWDFPPHYQVQKRHAVRDHEMAEATAEVERRARRYAEQIGTGLRRGEGAGPARGGGRRGAPAGRQLRPRGLREHGREDDLGGRRSTRSRRSSTPSRSGLDRPADLGPPVGGIRVVGGVGEIRLPGRAGRTQPFRLHPALERGVGLGQPVVGTRVERAGRGARRAAHPPRPLPRPRRRAASGTPTSNVSRPGPVDRKRVYGWPTIASPAACACA